MSLRIEAKVRGGRIQLANAIPSPDVDPDFRNLK